MKIVQFLRNINRDNNEKEMKAIIIFALVAIIGTRAFKIEKREAMAEAEAEFAAAEAETRWKREAKFEAEHMCDIPDVDVNPDSRINRSISSV